MSTRILFAFFFLLPSEIKALLLSFLSFCSHHSFDHTPSPSLSLTLPSSPFVSSSFPHSLLSTASLAKWLRRPPRKRKVRTLNPSCDRIFQGRVIPVTSTLTFQCLPCQAPGVIGSALGLVGPVSVYCDWVR